MTTASAQKEGQVTKSYATKMLWCVGGLVIALVLAYLPVVYAWMDRRSIASAGNHPRLVLQSNWFVDVAPSVYLPLLIRHAKMFGWEYENKMKIGDHFLICFEHSIQTKPANE